MAIIPDERAATAADGAARTIEIDADRSLHVAMGGAGSDIVVLHGALATSQDWLAGPFHELTRLGRVIAVDRPGHGLSRRPRFEAGPRAQAAQMRQGLKSIGIVRPVLVAHSFGSRTALAYAEQFPDEVASLVLVSPAVFPEIRPFEHAMLAPRAVPVGGPAWAQLMGWTFDRPMLEIVHQLMFAPQRPSDRWKRTYPWDRVLNPAQSVAQGEEFAEFHPLGPSDPIDVRSIAAPAHILAGTGDLIIDPRRQAELLAEQLPKARLTMVEGVGHMLHHAATQALIGAVEQALAA